MQRICTGHQCASRLPTPAAAALLWTLSRLEAIRKTGAAGPGEDARGPAARRHAGVATPPSHDARGSELAPGLRSDPGVSARRAARVRVGREPLGGGLRPSGIAAAAAAGERGLSRRAPSAHQLASYLGLVPLEDTSGGRDKRRLGSITKQGNAYLRALLTQAAHTILRHKSGDDPLGRWAKAIDERRGRHIAVVALAWRLSGVLWAMWRDGTVYDAQSAAVASAKGLRLPAQSIEQQAQSMKEAAVKARRRQRSIDKGLGAARATARSRPVSTSRRASMH
ncbi:transposase [Sorangium sp. So ce124]|uniref:transposase n=1 Tax=Sorangium sp. So ce124 TaxID=3133280 RepID=UPI003F5DB664